MMTAYACSIKSSRDSWFSTGYFFMILLLSIANLATDIFLGQFYGVISFVSVLIEWVVITGVAGGIWGVAVGWQWMWKWVNGVYLTMLTCLLAFLIAMLGFSPQTDLLAMTKLISLVAVLFPAQIQLYRYAYKLPWIWR